MELRVSAYNTNEKVYVQNDETGQCLARMCSMSIEIFGINPGDNCQFYKIIRKATEKDWQLFKSKVKEYYDFDLEDKYFIDAKYLRNVY